MRAILAAILGVAFVLTGASWAGAVCPSEFPPSRGEPIAYCQESTVPEAVVASARAYLSSRTNPSYQKVQYELLADATQVQRVVDCRGAAVAYKLVFDYAALRRVKADSTRINLFTPVDPACPVTGFVAVLAADGSVVEPKVTRDHAIEVARHDGGHVPADWLLSVAQVSPGSVGWQWELHFTEPPKGDCWLDRDITVDAESGKVLANTESRTCT